MSSFISTVGLYSPGFVNRLLSKSIRVFRVEYDELGNKIFDEGELASNDSEPSFFSGIFRVSLLDSDFLNQQEYLGSVTDDENPEDG